MRREKEKVMFNKNVDKETLRILMQENKRLKRENQRLNDSLDELQKYKTEYRNLIDEVKNIKERYLNKIKDFEKIENKYQKELNRIINN